MALSSVRLSVCGEDLLLDRLVEFYLLAVCGKICLVKSDEERIVPDELADTASGGT